MLITDVDGNVLTYNNEEVRLTYGPWGKARTADDWQYASSSPRLDGSLPDWMWRGYTGHEHMDEFGLINMNGRLYDPMIGRMLSPDNFVQNPMNTQGYNRYSYVLNNPLKYTDPSGEFLAVMHLSIGIQAEFLSNGINGYGWSLSDAYKSASKTVDGVSSAGQFPIYQNGNTTVTAGLDAYNFGLSINAYHTSGDFQFNAGAGVGFISPYYVGGGVTYTNGDVSIGTYGGWGKGYGSTESSGRYGARLTYHDRKNDQDFSAGLTHYTGSMAQTTWTAGYRNGDFSFAMENDAFLELFNGPSSDKYRTAGFDFGIGKFHYGFNIVTNDPNPDGLREGGPTNDDWPSPIHGPNKGGKGTYINGRRLASPGYIGYQTGNSISRIGVDAPWIQDYVQNGWHQSEVFRAINNGAYSPYFRTDYSNGVSPYLYSGPFFPYSPY